MIKTVRTRSDDRDFVELVQLLDEELHFLYGMAQKEYNKSNRIDLLDTVVIAYIGADAVGCGCFRKFNSTSVEIKRMLVRPAHRGQGHGKLILSALEQWAKEKGFVTSFLETGIKQPEAIALYTHMGYTVIDNYGMYQGNQQSICMRKSLK
jgi:putative acetyltransferase